MEPLRDVNTTDLLAAIRLGCRTMSSIFNADDAMRPFFRSTVWPHPQFGFSSWHQESHVPGRHLNALLNAEDAAGIAVSDEAIALHREAAFFSYGGPLPLPLNRETLDGLPVNFCPHNLREGFHALAALVRYRDDGEAQALAERSLAAIADLWQPERGWDVARLARAGVVFQSVEEFIAGEARMLGPLVKYYRATGSARALEAALQLRDKLLAEFFLDDGAFSAERFRVTHTHSITCTLSSLAQLAELQGDASLLARVKAFYDNGLWQMRDAIGWSPEVLEPSAAETIGEANNTGDILETALILGHAGYAECYHDAELILRCHLLPSQLRDVSFFEETANPRGEDALRDVAARHLGAWGFPAPYGHAHPGQEWLRFNMDIVGGVVGSLCEACRHVVRREADGTRVNLLFDWESPDARVESPYPAGLLRVTPRRPGPLQVRIPPWAQPLQVRETHCRRFGSWLLFPDPVPDHPLEIRFPLAPRELRLRSVGQAVRVRLHGDAVAGMDHLDAPLAFFPRYPAENGPGS